MRTRRGTLAAVMTVVAASGIALVAGSATGGGANDGARTSSISGTTTGDLRGPCDEAEHAGDPRCASVRVPKTNVAPARPGRDVSGPCDEAEHANDPRCTGVAAASAHSAHRADGGGIDVSGPCDEAEHANDPRCTGAVGAHDRGSGRGRGRGRSGGDHGGGNSGRGGGGR